MDLVVFSGILAWYLKEKIASSSNSRIIHHFTLLDIPKNSLAD
jgi:hypothetical protein